MGHDKLNQCACNRTGAQLNKSSVARWNVLQRCDNQNYKHLLGDSHSFCLGDDHSFQSTESSRHEGLGFSSVPSRWYSSGIIAIHWISIIYSSSRQFIWIRDGPGNLNNPHTWLGQEDCHFIESRTSQGPIGCFSSYNLHSNVGWILLRRDMASDHFTGCNSFTARIVRNRIAFLLQSRIGSLCIVNHRHIIPIGVGGSFQNSHHTQFVSESPHSIHSLRQCTKFSSKKAITRALLTNIMYPVRDRRLILSPAKSLSTYKRMSTDLPCGLGAFDGIGSVAPG